jgi:hypothetical protein
VHVDVINDLGVLLDSRVTFVNNIESIVLKPASILEFIKRISREFNDPYALGIFFRIIYDFVHRFILDRTFVGFTVHFTILYC